MASITQIAKQFLGDVAWTVCGPWRRPGCIVLAYHRIGGPRERFLNTDAADFRRQLEWLQAHCEVIGPERLREAAFSTTTSRPPVLLTFDDGYRDYHDVAYPILKEFGMPAVVFLPTAHIDDPCAVLWWDRLQLAVERARNDRLSLPWQPDRALPLGPQHTDAVIRECKRVLKQAAHDLKERWLDQIVAATGAPEPSDLPRQTMTWDEVRATMDLTVYGGHTHTHPLASKISAAQLDREIRICSERIFAETQVRPTLFCYPDGNYAPAAQELLPRHGFRIAFTLEEGINDETTEWLQVRRLSVGRLLPTTWMLKHAWTPTSRPTAAGLPGALDKNTSETPER